MGVEMKAYLGSIPGLTVQHFFIQDTGPGCSANLNTPCVGPETEPNWAASTNYSTNAHVQPTSGNPGGYVFQQTAGSCTSNSSAPTWPQTSGNSVSDNTCTWKNTGETLNAYLNQLDFEDNGTAADNVHLLNNVVRWAGGHNCLEVHYDTGAVLVAGNVVGPGCNHGNIDLKDAGSPSTPALVVGNTSTCGYSLSLCGCQVYGPSCTTNENPAFYMESSDELNTSTIIFQSNVAYDSGIGFQSTPNAPYPGGGANLCSGSGTCPINLKYYNNTVYIPPGAVSSYGIYSSNGNGQSLSGSSIDVRNNIFDGAASYSVSVPSGFGSHTEDYNDIGGLQGSPAFSFNGSSTQGAHDLSNANPIYKNAGGIPPDFTPTPGSPIIGAGLAGLTASNSNIGAY
jgi:hypothetical protein